VATGLLERLGTAANPCAALLAKAEAENADAGPAVDAETDSPSSVFPFADD
jgi:hypothetical protein